MHTHSSFVGAQLAKPCTPSYMFPITQVRIIDAYMPSVRGTMNAIRFIVNDPAPSSHLTLVKKSKLRSFAHHSHLQRKFSAKRWRKN
jgi:hypothetical protein